MQVTCPNCRARYAVDPLAIGPSGRTVQCARCNERWFETVKVAPAATPRPVYEAPKPDPAPREPAAAKLSSATLLSWLAFKPKPRKEAAKAREKAEPVVEPAPMATDAMPTAAPANDTEPRPPSRDEEPPSAVPDFVIRPATRGAMLPALIEPKADRRMGYVLAGTIAFLLLAAVGILAFHNAIAELLPPEWRSILHA